MLDKLREKLTPIPPHAHLEVADATNLPYPDHAFDVALSVLVLHLIPDWRQALQEIRRILRPGGLLIIGQERRTPTSPKDLCLGWWKNLCAQRGLDGDVPGASNDDVITELLAHTTTIQITEAASRYESATPREAIEHFANRAWNPTWDIPEDAFEPLIEQLRAQATAHWGNLDHTVQWRSSFSLVTVGPLEAGASGRSPVGTAG